MFNIKRFAESTSGFRVRFSSQLRPVTKSALRTTAILIVCLGSLGGNAASGGVIVNGDFSDATGTPFASWESPPPFQPAIDPGVNEFATLQVGDPTGFSAALIQQTFLLPANASLLLFEYMIEPSSTDPIQDPELDSFFATLAGGPDFGAPPITPEANFFQANNLIPPGQTSNETLGQGVSVRSLSGAGGWREVALDLSVLTVPLPTQSTLRFILLAGSDGIDTTVSIDNVRIVEQQAVVPEPASAGMWAIFAIIAIAGAWRSKRMLVAN